MSFLAEAVTNPAVDVSKLEALWRMQLEIKGENARLQYIDAMKSAQGEIMPVARTAENKQTHSFYAKLEDVDAAIRPIYSKHGFTLSFDEEAGDGTNMVIVCYVSHSPGGHTQKFHLTAPPDTEGPKGAPTKTALHGRGSTVTFLRRYLTCNIFNVVLRNQDDDGVRGGMKFVTADEILELEDLIAATKTDVRQFLAVMCRADIHAIDEIEHADFPRLKNSLLTKQAKLKKPADKGKPA